MDVNTGLRADEVDPRFNIIMTPPSSATQPMSQQRPQHQSLRPPPQSSPTITDNQYPGPRLSQFPGWTNDSSIPDGHRMYGPQQTQTQSQSQKQPRSRAQTQTQTRSRAHLHPQTQPQTQTHTQDGSSPGDGDHGYNNNDNESLVEKWILTLVSQMRELEMRTMILEHALVSQRQTIDVLLNFQKMHASFSQQTPLSHPSSTVSHRENDSTAVRHRENAVLDNTVDPTSSVENEVTLEGKPMVGGTDHQDVDRISSTASLFLNRSRWAV